MKFQIDLGDFVQIHFENGRKEVVFAFVYLKIMCGLKHEELKKYPNKANFVYLVNPILIS